MGLSTPSLVLLLLEYSIKASFFLLLILLDPAPLFSKYSVLENPTPTFKHFTFKQMKRISIYRGENLRVVDGMFFSDRDIDDAFYSLRLHQGAFRIYFLC